MKRVLLIAAALLARGAMAQEMTFVEPAAGTVRGTVPVRVDLGAGYQNGFCIFYLGEPGQALKFKTATVADPTGLFGFDWETQGRDAPYADGEYRLLAVGYNAAGEAVDQKAVTIEVQNQVTSTSLPARGVTLRLNLTPGRETQYIGRARVTVEPGAGSQGNDVGMFNGFVTGWWNQRVLWGNPDGRAHVRNSIFRYTEQGARGRPNRLDSSGQFVSLMLKNTGELTRRTELSNISFPFAQVGVDFPQQPVKVKDTWRSALRFVVDPRTGRMDEVIATHVLSTVEWHAGYRCAVIDSEWESGPYRLSLKGEDTSNEEWLADVTLSVKGNRRTYFAFQQEVGKVVRIEETQDQTCLLELMEEPPPAAAGGMMGGADMPGMPGMPGMPAMPGGSGGPPVMMPGGAAPGAGVPGAAGPEAGLGAQAPVVQKPEGFKKGGPGFRPAKPKDAGAVGLGGPGATTGPEGAAGPPPEPPKFDIMHFKRIVKTNINPDYLD